ncbi:MAG TPA: TolC family protein [Polyangia bacterium]
MSALRRGKLVLAVALALVGASSRARGQGAAIRVVTLPEALAYARAHQPAVRAALSRIAAEQALAAVPRAGWYPTAGLVAQMLEGTVNNTTASYLTASTLDIPRIGGTPAVTGGAAGWAPRPSTLAAVGVRQELFDFGRIAAQTAAADAETGVAAHAADATLLDVELGVEEAYFAVNAARSILRAAEDAYQRAKVHRDFAQAGVKSGLRSPIELTRAEADLTRFDTGRIRARGGLSVAQVGLAAAVGAPDSALDAAEGPTASEALPAISEALARAQAKDPRLAEAVARLGAQEQQTHAVSALLRPNLQLSATLSGRAGGAGTDVPMGGGFVPDVPNWDAALVLSWPLLDPSIGARARASRVAEEERRNEVDLIRQLAMAGVERAYLAVGVAQQALPALEHELEAARANSAQADARFKAGLGTSVELADAEALRTDAEIQLALGAFDLARARAAFGRAIAEGL